MKKKKVLIVLILVGLLLICWKLKRVDNVWVSIRNIQNTDLTNKVVYVNDMYYYYDAKGKGIFSYSKTQEPEKITDISEVWGIAANQDSLFYYSDEVIYQYNFEDASIKSQKIIAGENAYGIEDIYADEYYLFLMKETGIYVYSAEDICEKTDFSVTTEEIYQKNIIYDVDGTTGCIALLEQNDLIYTFYLLGSFDVDENDNLKLYQRGTGVVIPIQYYERHLMMSLSNKDKGDKVFGEDTHLAVYDEKLYVLEEVLEVYDKREMRKIKNEDLYYTVYGGDYALECSSVENNMLTIVASDYESGLTLESGPLKQHQGDNLWYVDMETNSVWKNYCFSKGEIVFYADQNKYILFKNGEIITYDVETREELSRYDAKWFNPERKGEEEQYEIVLCHDNWFVFKGEIGEGYLVAIVPMEEYLGEL